MISASPSRLPLFAVAILSLLQNAAFAGAWTQPKDRGQAIASVTVTKSPSGFDDDGDVVSIPRYDKLEANLLFEYGVSDWLTAMFQPQLYSVQIAEPTDADTFGLGYTEFGGRARLWSDKTSVVSGQVVARVPGLHDQNNPAEIGHTDPELDVRALFGHSFVLNSWQSFVDAQLAYRVRFDDPASEVRVDFTFGVRPMPKLLLLAQSFNTFADGSAEGIFSDTREHKVQLSAVWDVSDTWSIQLGGIATVAGENALRERGVVAALWHRF